LQVLLPPDRSLLGEATWYRLDTGGHLDCIIDYFSDSDSEDGGEDAMDEESEERGANTNTEQDDGKARVETYSETEGFGFGIW
jgi:hypothetical protein